MRIDHRVGHSSTMPRCKAAGERSWKQLQNSARCGQRRTWTLSIIGGVKIVVGDTGHRRIGAWHASKQMAVCAELGSGD